MSFGIPADIDDFLVCEFIILFVISFMLNTSTCNIQIVNDISARYSLDKNISSNFSFGSSGFSNSSLNLSLDSTYGVYSFSPQASAKSYFASSRKAFWIGLFLYWIAIPAICFYYSFFVFKKSYWTKDLNTNPSTVPLSGCLKMDEQKLVSNNRRGFGNVKIAVLIGALIFIVLVGALGPTMFGNLSIVNAPSWYNTVAPLIVGAGLIMAIWKVFQ